MDPESKPAAFLAYEDAQATDTTAPKKALVVVVIERKVYIYRRTSASGSPLRQTLLPANEQPTLANTYEMSEENAKWLVLLIEFEEHLKTLMLDADNAFAAHLDAMEEIRVARDNARIAGYTFVRAEKVAGSVKWVPWVVTFENNQCVAMKTVQQTTPSLSGNSVARLHPRSKP